MHSFLNELLKKQMQRTSGLEKKITHIPLQDKAEAELLHKDLRMRTDLRLTVASQLPVLQPIDYLLSQNL